MPANALRLNNVAMIANSGPSFVGPLDALVAQGATLLFAGSVRRLLSSWTGNAMRLQGNGAGNPIAAIPFLANGDLDLTAAAAAAADGAGTTAYGETWYDQSGRLDATQTTILNQMEFSTSVEAKGGFGGLLLTARWLNLNLGTLPQPSFLSFAVNVGATVSGRILIGSSATSFNRYCRLTTAPDQHWGSLLAAGNISTGKALLGFLTNGASSAIYTNGTLSVSGNAGNTQLDMSGGRIGSSSSPTTNWTASASNTLSECIIFSNDPTGLAGWADFVADQKTYFGVS
jgi:hypothetical protein